MEDRELTFDFAEGLVKDNLLMVDRETGSLWSQLGGRAIGGPLKDAPLAVIPSLQTTWKHWRETHAGTRVLVVEGEKGRPYLYRSPHAALTPERPLAHDTSALGLGLAVDGEAMFFPFQELERADLPLRVELGGRPVWVRYRKDGLTAWAEDAAGNLLAGVLAYEGAWLGFNPDARVYRTER